MVTRHAESVTGFNHIAHDLDRIEYVGSSVHKVADENRFPAGRVVGPPPIGHNYFDFEDAIHRTVDDLVTAFAGVKSEREAEALIKKLDGQKFEVTLKEVLEMAAKDK